MRSILGNCRGATAVEYSLIAALVSIAAIAGMQAAGHSVASLWTMVGSAITSALP